MRVRVYDPARDACFLSELYAILYDGVFAQCLICPEGQLRLCRQLLPGEDGNYRTMASMVDPDFPPSWLHLTGGDLAAYPDFPRPLPEDRWTVFRGYPWIWEDQPTLRRLLRGESVPLAGTGYPAVSSLLPGWRYVADSAGAEAFLAETSFLHDAVLAEARYVSGSGRHPGGMAVCDYVRQVTLLFHCVWSPTVEMVFEGVKAFHLYPGGNNCVSALSEAVCRVSNAVVVFCEDFCEEGEEERQGGTCVQSYSMRWRFLPEAGADSLSSKTIF